MKNGQGIDIEDGENGGKEFHSELENSEERAEEELKRKKIAQEEKRKEEMINELMRQKQADDRRRILQMLLESEVKLTELKSKIIRKNMKFDLGDG